ncbi:MAG: lytic transglycosylase domain-containing protein, partial [Betaproteobacteria bacterium]|nr:lytic transglycosylase domain-containing protein [Betaproteobacteria bacterium]
MAAVFDPVTNLRVGVGILKEYLSRDATLEQALKTYVGAAN